MARWLAVTVYAVWAASPEMASNRQRAHRGSSPAASELPPSPPLLLLLSLLPPNTVCVLPDPVGPCASVATLKPATRLATASRPDASKTSAWVASVPKTRWNPAKW